MKPFSLAPLAMLPLLCLCARAQDAPDGFDISKWQRNGVSLEAGAQGRSRLTFEPGNYPNVHFSALSPRDWTGRSLELETFNPSVQPLDFYVRLDDDPQSDGWHGCGTAKMTALPGQTQRWIISSGEDPMAFGMRALPPLQAPGGATLVAPSGAAPLDERHIVGWQLFLSHPAQHAALEVGEVKLVPAPQSDLSGILDGFGQYTRADWPGKIHSLAQLQTARAAEERDLSAKPQVPGRDRFGGKLGGPGFAATGFFRTQKDGDRWWLVTPEGHAFWSAGVDVVGAGEATITSGRETMFASLPKPDEPLARFVGQQSGVVMGPQKGKPSATFDFYGANLFRKYGDNWKARWQQTALARLRSWGFNTVGNWSDAALTAPENGPARLPYTATVGIWGDHAQVSSGDDYWGAMADPFDPKFIADCQARVAEVAAHVKSDPFCLGYFVDNELSWGSSDDSNPRAHYGLALGALALDATSPAKIAFTGDLKAKYSSIGALNAAWNTHFASWNELNAPVKLADTPNDAQQGDFSAFLAHFADQYFSTVSAAIRKADPNHLYLGCRFAWRTPEAVASAARWCDVVSFNIYARRLDANEWAFAGKLNKPVLIGEFHMGALDRGMFHPGLVAAKDQNERASLFAAYIQSVAQNPSFVGAHWFQYADEPVTGRWFDGENYNIGFVSATDAPYPELVAAARAANANVYRWHAGQ